jgi:dephospho-CoA kinase
MILIGLTGGIGSGKSTVARMLAAKGAEILDADAMVHDLQRSGTDVFRAMVELLGPESVGADGELDRQWIADRVFTDPALLAELNGVVHPAVRQRMAESVIALAGTDAIAIMDVPLLTESGMQGMAGVIVVDIDPEIAVERLVTSRGFSVEDARARISRQVSRSERLARADKVIDNSGDLDQLQAQVDEVWRWIETLAAQASERTGEDSTRITFEN